MIRTKGEAGSNIVEAVTHMRTIMDEIKLVTKMNDKELEEFSINNNAPLNILTKVKELGKLPVPNFSAGGIATPADASLMMQLGAESVFVGFWNIQIRRSKIKSRGNCRSYYLL